MEKNIGESKSSSATDYREFVINDKNGGNHIKIITDWNFKGIGDEDRIVEVRVGDKKSFINFNHLWSLVFMMSKHDEQDNLIPVKTGRVRMIEKMVEVVAHENVKKGDKVRFKIEFSVPEEMFVQKTGSGILKPFNK